MLEQSQSSSWHSVSLFSFFFIPFHSCLWMMIKKNKMAICVRNRAKRRRFFSRLWWVRNQGSSDTRLLFFTVFQLQLPVIDANYILFLGIRDLFLRELSVSHLFLFFLASGWWKTRTNCQYSCTIDSSFDSSGCEIRVLLTSFPSWSSWLKSTCGC